MQTTESSGADQVPHEFVDVEIAVKGIDGPADEQKLSAALSAFDGIRDFSVSDGMVTAEYEPVLVTKAELCDAIVRAGFHVTDMEAGCASTIADALHGESSDATAGPSDAIS